MISKINFEDVGGFAFLGGLCKVGQACAKSSALSDPYRLPLMKILNITGTLFHATSLYYFSSPQLGSGAIFYNLTGVLGTALSAIIQMGAVGNRKAKPHPVVIASHLSVEMIALSALIVSSIGIILSSKHRSVCITASAVQTPYWVMKFYAEVPHLSERSAVRAPKQPEFIQEMKGTDVIYIGREDLIDNVLDVICADIKNNNVILLGEPGIGKTQMARFLAAQIQKGELTDLQGYRVFASTAKDLIAGAKYVGAKEERIKELFSFLKGVDEEVILFIDEIWQLIGTGIGERGTTDIAGTLLTEIEDQGVVVIGATTPKEGGFLLRNRAFLDRFQIVEVEPMSQAERTEILKAHIRKYQERGISIPDDFAEIISAINLKGGGRSLRKDIDMLGIIVSRMKRKGISAEQAARERGLLQLDRSPTGDK